MGNSKERPKEIKAVWFYSNLAFIINYTLTCIKLFVTIPVPYFSHYFNNLCLLVSYSILVLDLLKNYNTPGFSFKKIYTNQNFMCIFLFICFIPNILLFPFFMLSVFHVNNVILSQKKLYESYFFYDLCVMLGRHSNTIGRSSMYCEVILLPIGLILVFLGQIRVFTFMVYCTIIRQQYICNSTMRSVIEEIIFNIDKLISKMPAQVATLYTNVKENVSKYNKPETIPNKKE